MAVTEKDTQDLLSMIDQNYSKQAVDGDFTLSTLTPEIAQAFDKALNDGSGPLTELDIQQQVNSPTSLAKQKVMQGAALTVAIEQHHEKLIEERAQQQVVQNERQKAASIEARKDKAKSRRHERAAPERTPSVLPLPFPFSITGELIDDITEEYLLTTEQRQSVITFIENWQTAERNHYAHVLERLTDTDAIITQLDAMFAGASDSKKQDIQLAKRIVQSDHFVPQMQANLALEANAPDPTLTFMRSRQQIEEESIELNQLFYRNDITQQLRVCRATAAVTKQDPDFTEELRMVDAVAPTNCIHQAARIHELNKACHDVLIADFVQVQETFRTSDNGVRVTSVLAKFGLFACVPGQQKRSASDEEKMDMDEEPGFSPSSM